MACYKTSAQGFEAGVLLGLNTSQVSGDNLAGYNKPGLAVAGTLGKKINEKSGLEFRIAYSAKGSRDVPNFEKGKYTAYYLKLHYIEVPIFYRYTYKKFCLMGGPSIGVLLKSSIQNESGDYPTNSPENRPFNKIEISTNFGISYRLSDQFEVEFRTNDTFPFTPIRKHASGASYRWNYGQLNSLLTFGLKYNFKKS
jgi:hypothetical protein